MFSWARVRLLQLLAFVFDTLELLKIVKGGPEAAPVVVPTAVTHPSDTTAQYWASCGGREGGRGRCALPARDVSTVPRHCGSGRSGWARHRKLCATTEIARRSAPRAVDFGLGDAPDAAGIGGLLLGLLELGGHGGSTERLVELFVVAWYVAIVAGNVSALRPQRRGIAFRQR